MNKAERLFEKLRTMDIKAFLEKHPDLDPVIKIKSKLPHGVLEGKVPKRAPRS